MVTKELTLFLPSHTWQAVRAVMQREGFSEATAVQLLVNLGLKQYVSLSAWGALGEGDDADLHSLPEDAPQH